jgi:hypothetical protein
MSRRPWESGKDDSGKMIQWIDLIHRPMLYVNTPASKAPVPSTIYGHTDIVSVIDVAHRQAKEVMRQLIMRI